MEYISVSGTRGPSPSDGGYQKNCLFLFIGAPSFTRKQGAVSRQDGRMASERHRRCLFVKRKPKGQSGTWLADGTSGYMLCKQMP